MLNIIKKFQKDGWVFRWKSDSKCIIAHHAKRSKSPVCEILFPSGKDGLGQAITDFLNKSPKKFPIDANINWSLLREQKATLLKVITPFYDPKPRNAHHLEGILHLIDNIQDSAVESGKWTEKEVFD